MALESTVSVVGWFVSPLISKLLEHRVLNWKEKEKLKKSFEEEIDGLRRVLPSIKNILDDAEEKQLMNPGARDWLGRLREVLYDAEDVLDMYEVDLLLKNQRDSEPPSKKKVNFSISFRSSKQTKDGARSSSRLSVAKEIKRIRKELDLILKQGSDFGQKDMVQSTPQDDPGLLQKRKTTSYPGDDEATFVGRDDVKKEMIKQLVPDMESSTVHPGDDEERFSVLPIVGMGGLGKTTLAQRVFNDKRVVDFYKSRAWVCVGQSHDLDPIQTTANIIESMRSFQGKKEACNFRTLSALQKTLLDEIKEPFLLVLDDAWDADSNTWDKLLAPLKARKKRCQVIVTTRDENVAGAFHDRLHIRRLDFLDNDSVWSIFEKSAFGTEDAREFPELETIGRNIVQRLKGLPLAAKTIGSILSGNRNERDWMRILESEQLLKNNQEEDDMLSILIMSYCNLPVIMKQYFSCFLDFPKGYPFRNCIYHGSIDKFPGHEWMAQRILQIEAKMNSKYDKLDNDAVKLMSKLLLQCDVPKSDSLVHFLARKIPDFIDKNEYLRVTDAALDQPIPKEIRHISISGEKFNTQSNLSLLEDLHEYRSLRTLFYDNLSGRLNTPIPKGLLDSWFTNLCYLKTLSLHNCNILELPDSIGNLKLLRYLDLFLPKIEKLPAKISHLNSLQVLKLRGCDSLSKLPNSVTRLDSLSYLNVDPRLLQEVKGIGQLTNLQELEEFHIKEKEGHGINELKKLNGLRDSLCIFNLEKIKNKESPKQAELNQKESLEEIKLVWCSDENKEMQLNVLEGLCPSAKTSKLMMQGYMGLCLPSWLINQSISLTSLLELNISGCPNVLEIPFLPLPLRDLKLSNVGVNSLFSSVSPIHLPYLQNLEVIWCNELGESLNDLLKAASSSLQRVVISGYNCPLEALFNLSTLLELVLERCRERVFLNGTALFSLRTLHIVQCPDVVIKGTCPDSEICSSLTSLRIRRCPTLLESFSQWRVLLTSLTDLYFSSNCDDSIPSKYMDDTRAFVCLKSLTISECPRLVELDFHDLRSLRSLYIRDCRHLTFRSSFSNPLLEDIYVSGLKVQQLVDLIIGLSKSPIKSLTIENCYDMESFDGKLESVFLVLNKSLECLHIGRCLKLNCLPSYLGVFENLRSLKIEKCPRMSTLPDGDLPISLQELWIIECPALEAEYKQNVSRQACISYIPDVHI